MADKRKRKVPAQKPDLPAAAEDDAGPGDKRVRRSRAAVLDITAQLLFERGFGGATVDEISRRSGIAKTTIYRHWPTRADLLRDAGSKLETPLSTPDEGSFEADVTALMRELAHSLRTARWPAALPSVIDAAERDASIAELYRGLQQGFSTPFLTVIERAVQKGELPEDTDAALLVAALTGALFYRRWYSREPLTDEFVSQVVRLVTRQAA